MGIEFMDNNKAMNCKNKFNALDGIEHFSDLPSSSEEKKPIRKLYISNFWGKVNPTILKDLFSQYGEIIECRGPFVNIRGHHFAFITFSKPEEAHKALEAGRRKEVILFKNKPLNIMPSFPHTQPTESQIKKLLSKKTKKKRKKTKPENQNKNKNKKKTKNIKTPKIDYINKIDDDCLINIFVLLPMNDRMRIERVCKRWQDVSARAWHDIKELDLTQPFQFSNSNSKAQIKNRTVEKILERCGRFLSTLQFSTCNLGYNAETLPVIGEHCKNLTRLTLQLRKHPNKELNKLFAQFKKIQYLEIKDIGKDFKCNSLASLPHDTIEEIHLSTKVTYESFDPHLRSFGRSGPNTFRKFSNIRSLTMTGFILKPDLIKVIAEKTHLTYLSLANCSIKQKNIIKLACLRKLEYLNLSKVLEVTSDFLIALASNCTELKYLNITDCSSVSNSGIAALSMLPQLETLIINELYDITDVTVSNFVSLQELHCENCEQIQDAGIMILLQTAPNLKILNLFNTSISTAVLDTAEVITRKRTNNLLLRIKVNTMVLDEWEDRTNPSPLLDVEGKDETVSDVSDEFLYDHDDDDDLWDLGIDDEFDDYDADEYDFDEFDYNGVNPFFLF
ncbi:F-box/LRR-repeat protein 7-like [Microplitis mediator]|uniref:F-box/LRR-repeat protein 7-like n=1 Tax=Microplitis mediator TaxID=375433 RepID=UPI0025558892|nr:F-box/LRR-repeat protein 7-like [Microplitis mediator]